MLLTRPRHAIDRRDVYLPRQRQCRIRNGPRLVVDGGPSQPQQLALSYDRQGMRAIDHRVALGKPALMSAPSKKSFFSASYPIFAWSVFRSGVSDGECDSPNTSAARASSCCFHSVICVGLTFPRFHRHLYQEEFDAIGGLHESQDQTAVHGRV